jgi:hypothetical protein
LKTEEELNRQDAKIAKEWKEEREEERRERKNIQELELYSDS